MATTLFVIIPIILAILGSTLYFGCDHKILTKWGQEYHFLNRIGELFHAARTQDMSASPSSKNNKLNQGWSLSNGPKYGYPFLTDSEIAYVEGGKSYLVIIGSVFDVSSSGSYKPESGYHVFIGRDASRAFVTGDFTATGCISDIDGLNPEDYRGLLTWMAFYYKTYRHIGYHIGRFYDKSGKETDSLHKFRTLVAEANSIERAEDNIKKEFPPCNMEWTAKTEITEYWCSRKSGGINRDWEGYPYQFQEEEGKPYRCACINTNYLKDSRVKPYENCPAKSNRCKISKVE